MFPAWRWGVDLNDHVMIRQQTDWDRSKMLAKAILHDRKMRRRWLGRWLVLTLAWMAVGLWLIDSWLAQDPWRFLIWWAACGVLACGLIVFALYDAAAVVREERDDFE